MRYEANETIKNHEKSMEKYQQLMKKKIQDAHQKTRIQKKTTNFTDFEIMYQDDGKKREYEKTVGEFFDKIKEMRKERSFFGEIDDIEESLIENEASFHINEKKQEFLLQNNKIEGGNIKKVKKNLYNFEIFSFKKPHLTDMSKIIEKTNEQHNNKSDISDIYTNSLKKVDNLINNFLNIFFAIKKSVINEKYQIKEETYMDKTNNSFAQKSNLKKVSCKFNQN